MDAIIFDMDGTLFNTEAIHLKAFTMTLKEYGVDYDRMGPYTPQIAGKTSRYALGLFKEAFGLDYDIEEANATKQSHLLELYRSDPSLTTTDGVVTLLNSLRAQRIPLAIASSSPMVEIETLTELFDIDVYFDAMVSGQDLINPKPHPQLFWDTAQKLNVFIEKCIVFEDSEAGVQAGIASGALTVGFDNPETPQYDLSPAHRRISSFKEVDYDRLVDWSIDFASQQLNL